MKKPSPSLQITGIVLAAGRSQRFQGLKQSHRLKNGHTMVENAIKVLQGAGLKSVIVITGYEAEKVKADLSKNFPQIPLVHHADWEKGMGSSIKCGIRALSGTCQAALILACDQVEINSQELTQLIALVKEPSDLAAAKYAKTLGIPALFGKDHFNDLLKIEDSRGAKDLLLSKGIVVKTLALPSAEKDLDQLTD